MTPLAQFVQPGDVLLIDGSSWISTIIHLKTWDRDASHAEVVSALGADGAVETFTARGGQDKTGIDGRGGVNFYGDLPRWAATVTMVLRPLFPFDATLARVWATGCVGQRYDYLGLLVFTLAVAQGAQDKMFCSEAVTRFLRAGGGVPFPADVDADRVAPTTFRYTTAFAHYPVRAGEVLEATA